MRVLFEHWIYSATNLEGISLFNTYRLLADGLRELGEPVVAYYAAPRSRRPGDKKDPIDWSPNRLEDLGFEALSVGMPYMQRTTFPHYEPEFIQLVRDKDFCADFVLTGNYPGTLGLQCQQRSDLSKWDVECPLPIVNYYSETTMDNTLPDMRSREVAGAIALGGACTPICVMNEFELVELGRLGKAYLSASMQQRLTANLFVLPPCFEWTRAVADFDKFEEQRAARTSVRVFHGGSTEKKRHIPALVNAVKRARQIGGDIELFLTTQGTMEYEEPWIHVISKCAREQYLQSFGEGDLLWMGSDYEGTGIGYMEAVASGMMPICFRNAQWVQDRVNPAYPAQIENPENIEDVASMIHACAMGLDRLRTDWQKDVRDRMARFSNTSVAQSLMDNLIPRIQPRITKNMTIAKSSFAFQFLENAVRDGDIGDEIKIVDVPKIMTSKTDTGMEFGWVGYRGLRYMLMSLGYKDTCEGAEIVLRKA